MHGAIVFDVYVANNDRAFGPHRRNLLLDAQGQLLLYDNGNACFYRNRPKAGIEAGIARLDAVEANMAAMFDMDHKANHYREFLTDPDLVKEWCERVAALPDFVIESAVRRIPPNSATEGEPKRLVKFLVMRKENLFDQIMSNKQFFTGLPQ